LNRLLVFVWDANFIPFFYKDKTQYCPGEVCDAKSKQPIQKTSKIQLLVIVAFIACIFLTVFLFKDHYSKKPYDMFGINGSQRSK